MADWHAQPQALPIHLVPGSVAPRFEDSSLVELRCTGAVITEQGTQAQLPIVDFMLEDAEGRRFVFTTTGRIVNMVSAAIKGANIRNHGIAEP